MAELFESSFARYSHVHRYPRKASLTGYEWTLECDLDSSFEFLFAKSSLTCLESLSKEEFLAFLAGFFDAEGSIMLHNKRNRFNPEVQIVNTDEAVLEFLQLRIQRLGFSAKLDWSVQSKERGGIAGYSRKGRVSIWRFQEVQRFLRMIPLRQAEKTTKVDVVCSMTFGESRGNNLETAARWEEIVSRIKQQRDVFVSSAKLALEAARG